MARRGTCRAREASFGDGINDYTAGEDQLVFAGMEGISYTGRVFEIVDGDPFGSTEQAIDADPSIQNEIAGGEAQSSRIRIQGHLYVKGVGSGADFDQMHIMLHDVSEPPPVADVLFGIPPDAVIRW